MALLHAILLFAALLASTKAQLAGRATGSTKVLQPWLVGLTAVVVFLFIVFVLMIVNRLVCKKKRNTDIDLHSPQGNVYENMALEMEDGNKEGEDQSMSRPSQGTSKSPPEKVEWQPESKQEVKITSM